MKRLSFPVLLGLLAACGQGDGPSGAPSEEAAAAAASAEMAAASYSYEVRLVFGEDAARTLAERGEQVTVASEYFGRPRGAPDKSAGSIDAQDGRRTIIDGGALTLEPVDQLVRIVSPVIEPATLKVIDGEPMLLVTVAGTAPGAAGQGQMIEGQAVEGGRGQVVCSNYDGSLAVATVRPILIECGLATPGGGAPEPAEAP